MSDGRRQQMARVNVDDDVWTDLRIEAMRTSTSVADYLGRLVTREVERLRRKAEAAEGRSHDEVATEPEGTPSQPRPSARRSPKVDLESLDQLRFDPPSWRP